jgi:hypothetical protein
MCSLYFSFRGNIVIWLIVILSFAPALHPFRADKPGHTEVGGET